MSNCYQQQLLNYLSALTLLLNLLPWNVLLKRRIEKKILLAYLNFMKKMLLLEKTNYCSQKAIGLLVNFFLSLDDNLLYIEESKFLFSYLPEIKKQALNLSWVDSYNCKESFFCQEVLYKKELLSLEELKKLDLYLLLKNFQPSALATAYGFWLFFNLLKSSSNINRNNIKKCLYYLTQGKQINNLDIFLKSIYFESPWCKINLINVEDRKTLSINKNILKDTLLLRGRVDSIRIHKYVIFCNLIKQLDSVQVCFERSLEEIKKKLKVGDYIEITGLYGVNKKGNQIFFFEQFVNHIPNKLVHKSQFIQTWKNQSKYSSTILQIKDFMKSKGFIEVSTPILYSEYEGGDARPFITYENHKKITNYLRVTSEVTILKYLAGGAEKIFEIGPSFRNENSRDRNSVEYDLFEAYSTLHSFEEFYNLMIELIKKLLPKYVNHNVIDYVNLLKNYGVDINSLVELRQYANKLNFEVGNIECPVELSRVIFKKEILNKITGMTVINNIPGKGSPYIKSIEKATRRSWIIIDGLDIAEIAENEVSYEVFTKKLHGQFSCDEQFVLRSSDEIRKCLLSGLPNIVGIGLGVARLNNLVD